MRVYCVRLFLGFNDLLGDFFSGIIFHFFNLVVDLYSFIAPDDLFAYCVATGISAKIFQINVSKCAIMKLSAFLCDNRLR